MAMTRRRWFAVAAAAPVAWVASREALGRRARPTFGASYFPNVRLTAHDGRQVRFYDDLLRDRIVLVNFMYATCDGLCPLATANLARVHALLGARAGRDVFMYSITLKPEQDTPEVLRRYAMAYGTGRGWSFLTGARDDIEAIRRRLGQVDPDPTLDRRAAQHTGIIRYGNVAAERWGACAVESTPEWIAKTVLSIATTA
jgi:protein SCO1/2